MTEEETNYGQPISISPDNIRANVGETVTLTCQSSNPRLTLTWTKSQNRLPSNAQNNNGILTLNQVWFLKHFIFVYQ